MNSPRWILHAVEVSRMSFHSNPSQVLTWVIALLLCRLSDAAATDVTKIDRLPYRITHSGAYQLTEDLHFEQLRGAAISVEADDVSIDLNGATLSGTADASTLAVGIQSSSRSRITITNGRITGFYFGIDLRAPTDGQVRSHVVSDLVLSRNQYFGMRVVGAQSEVQRCTILDTGGSTRPGHTIPHGVRLVGAGTVMRDCQVIDLRLKRFDDGKGEIVGVHFDAAKDSVFERNLVVEQTDEADDQARPDDSKERTFGIWINGGPEKDTFVEVRNNTFVGFTVPVVFAPGSDGRASDNAFYDADRIPVRGKPAGN